MAGAAQKSALRKRSTRVEIAIHTLAPKRWLGYHPEVGGAGSVRAEGAARWICTEMTAAAPKAQPHDEGENPALEVSSEHTHLKSVYIEDPGTKPVFGFEPVLVARIARLGLPVIVGMLTQTAINMIDNAMVGRLPQDLSVPGKAALGPSLIVLWAFGGFLSSISVGTQALTARRFGEGNPSEAGRVLTNSYTLAFIASAVVTVVAIGLTPIIFNVVSPDPAVREIGTSYLQIRFIGLFSMVMMASYKSFYDGLGRVRVHMTIAIGMNLLNVLLNWIFIFGNLGAPRLEVAGAAWGSVLSSSAGLGAIILWSMRKKDRKVFRPYRPSNLDATVAWAVAKLSLWSGLAILFAMSGFAMFFVIVGRVDAREGLAGVNTAAASEVINISLIVFMTCIAFGTATATLISQSLGAKNPALARRYGEQSIRIIVLVMSVVGAIASAYPEALLRVFLPEIPGETEMLKDMVINVAALSLSIAGIGAPIVATALVLAQALYGAGESRFVMMVEGGLHFTCLVPLAYLFAIVMDQGLLGCWMAAGVYGLGLVIAVVLKFRGTGWTTLEI